MFNCDLLIGSLTSNSLTS